MKLNNKKKFFYKNLFQPISVFIFLISLISLKGESINAEYFEELHIDNTTKTEDDASAIPNNPFEIVEMIRRHNSMNDATNPYDAISDALDSFNNLEVDSEI